MHKKQTFWKRCIVKLLIAAVLLTMMPGLIPTVEAYEDAYPLPELTGDQAQDTANIALSQLGYIEEAGNGTIYGEWWSSQVGGNYAYAAWCGMFAAWCAYHAGAGLNIAYNKSAASTNSLYSWFVNNGRADSTFSEVPEIGDFVFFSNSRGSTSMAHVAIVVGYDADSNVITFVGGNQSDMVTKRTVTWSEDGLWGSQYVAAIGKPYYTKIEKPDQPTEPTTPTDPPAPSEPTEPTQPDIPLAEGAGIYAIATSRDPLNIRDKRSTSGKVVGKIPKDTLVNVYSVIDGWAEVEYQGVAGFVSADYCRCVTLFSNGENHFYAALSEVDSGVYLETASTELTLSGERKTDEPRQLWYFAKQDGGSYRIESCYHNMVLTVDGTQTVLKPLQTTQSQAQQWYLTEDGNLVSRKDNAIALTASGNNVTAEMYSEANMLVVDTGGIDYAEPGLPAAPTVTVQSPAFLNTEATISWTESPLQSDRFDARSYRVEIWDPSGVNTRTVTGLQETELCVQFDKTGDWTIRVTAYNDKYANKWAASEKVTVAVLDAHSHQYHYTVETAPTLTAAGTLKGVCDCGAETSVQLPLLNTDNYSYHVVQAPSCVKQGTGRYTWNVTTYGTFYFDVPVAATGHHYVAQVTKEPTCIGNGIRTYTCDACGSSYTEEIPATGIHTYDTKFTIDKPATADTDGEMSRHCTTTGCDARVEITLIPARGHSVSGTVTNHGSAGKTTIQLLREDGTVAYSAVVLGSGNYHITHVTNGKYILQAMADGVPTAQCSIAVSGSDVTENIVLYKESELITKITHTLDLGGMISMSYHVTPGSGVSGVTAEGYLRDGVPGALESIPATDGRYHFTYPVAAKQMTDEIYFEVTAEKDGVRYTLMPDVFTVEQYCTAVISQANAPANLKEVARNMLTYGAYAQKYFGYNVDNLANKNNGVALDPTAVVEAVKKTGTDFHGTVKGQLTSNTLLLESEVGIRYFLTLNAGVNADNMYLAYYKEGTAEVNYVKVTYENGRYHAVVPNIAAKNLSSYYVAYLCEKNGETYTQVSQTSAFSAACYAYAVYSNANAPAELKDCVVAMMMYGNAAKTLFGV